MRCSIIFLFFLVSFSIYGQTFKEFEGVIRYKHYYNFSNYYGDSSDVKKSLGTSSEFYYKKGNYKWVINGGKMTIEFFDSNTQTVYSFYDTQDTLWMSNRNGRNDSLELFKIEETKDSVCGLLCNKVETFSRNVSDSLLSTRRVLYYSEEVSLAPGRFYGYRSYGSNIVFDKIKCWPIRLELTSILMPFLYVIEAIEIIPKPLNDSDVLMPPNKPIRSLW